MKEMDLEELDQEVSKLMDQASKAKAKPASNQPAVTPATPAKATDDDSGTPVAVRHASLQITPRKQGIAMDIVQSKTATPPPPSNRPARVAPTIQPTKSVTTDDEVKVDSKPDKADQPEPKVQPEKDDVSESTLASIDLHADGKAHPATLDDETNHKSVFPDPLEVHGFKEEETKKPDEQPATSKPDEEKVDDSPTTPAEPPTMQHTTVITPPTEDEQAAAEDEVTKAVEAKTDINASEADAKKPDSPFVDTKVEKRPLGAYADSKSDANTQDTQTSKVDDSKQDGHVIPEEPVPNHAEPASIAIQTPKELSAEVVAVESAEPEFTPGAPKDAPAEDQNDMNSLRQMAIPQQYHEVEKQPDQKDRPVFDTKEYHTPLQPAPVAHNPGRAGTVLTVILILLMIGAAILAYFVLTGSIDISRFL